MQKWPLAVVLAALAPLFCTGARAADPALVSAAEKEGGFMLYACDVGETPPQIKNFEKLYPKVKVSSYVAGCWQTYNRNQTEASAGRPIADIMQATEDVLSKLNDDGALQDYSPADLKAFPPGAKPKGANYIIYKTQIVGFGYNTDVVKGIKTPADWQDFGGDHPEWKGKISFFDPRTSSAAFSVLATLYQQFGPDGAGKIYAGLHGLDAALTATTPAGVAKMLSGERPILFYILSNQVGELIAKGAPVKFSIPTSGAVSIGLGVGILKTAAHKAAAQLFATYMLNEGQQIVSDRRDYGLRLGLTPPAGMPALDTIKTLPTDFRAALKQQPELISFWQKSAGIQ